MVMTPQQARMAAIRLQAAKPELQSVAIDDLVAQIMASESEAAPGAGVGALANLFPTKLSPASPAPMRAAELEAPKPTAMIIPNAARSGPAIPVGAGPRSANPPLADWQKEHLARMEAGLAMPEGQAAPVEVVEAVPEVAAEAPVAAKAASRFRPLLEQKEAELEQLNERIAIATQTGRAVPPDLAYNLQIKSGEVSQLKGMVAAEEGAAVDPERAAILDRQMQRLGREEELVEQARKRAPFDALIAGGAALAGAKPGESFASAFARGLQAGSQAYRGALDAREASLQGIEEKRDAFTLQKIDALQRARDSAIALSEAGVALSKQQMDLANLSDQGILAEATRGDKIRGAKAEAAKLETQAKYADQLAQLDIRLGEARIGAEEALAAHRRRPPAERAAAGPPKPVAGLVSALTSRINVLTKALSDPLVSDADKKAYRDEIRTTKEELAVYKRQFGIGTAAAAPAFGPVAQTPAKPIGRIVSSKPIQ
jgi:hypothetical protein